MARMGKRERMAKRALIKGNLNSPREATPYTMRSYLAVDRMLGRTHCGFRDPQNAKGSESTVRSGARFDAQPGRVPIIRGPVAEISFHDTNRKRAAVMAARKLGLVD